MSLSSARKRNTYSLQDNAPVELSSLFRSKNYPAAGSTRRVGNMHMHLDCSKSETSEGRLVEIAQILERQGWPSKVSRVNLARGGMHLSDPEYVEDYLEHTPELCAGTNTFAAYLTTLMAPEVNDPELGKSLCKQARTIMAEQSKGFSEADVVIEIERVTALIDEKSIQVAGPATFPLSDKTTRPLYEVHHLVDLPRSSAVEFDEWQALCNLSGIVVGGWFRFDKKDEQALRSVKFARSLDVLSLIKETRELNYILREHLDVDEKDMHVQTVVEQVVDIWRL